MINYITYLILMYSVTNPTELEALELANEIVHISYQYNQDPILVTALAYRESGLDQNSINKKSKSFGIMHLHPKWWGKGVNRLDRVANLEAGVKALHYYKRYCHGEIRSVSAYRSGSCHTVGEQTYKVMQLTRVWRNQYYKRLIISIGDITFL